MTKSALFDALATAVLELTPELRIAAMNTSAEGLFGISARRACGQKLAEVGPYFSELAELCARALAQQRSYGGTLQLPAPQRDGSELDLAVRVSPVEGASSGGLLLELFDITQRHQLDRETALVAQHGVSRRMLQQLAHEIRNPLGGLRGAAQLLQRELGDPAQREFTRVIIGEADRLEGLVSGLLGPHDRADMQHANIHEVLEHVAMLVHSDAPALSLVRDYDPSLPPLLIDRDQMTQALLNLLRNAAQATDNTGTLILRSRARTNQVLSKQLHRLVAIIEIEDDGPGVPADIADTIFYPLVSGKPQGSGIGLPLAQELVNRHQGLIEFTSEPGRTVFTVSLPVVQPRGEQPA